ncbi:zf-HC2 domain-containing protein [Kineosporia babensis]|uniref:Zf-HC2 domain-containing protein n=1 Tax=Kineosporia babensis TaxID=499548 RepID=A0A9X1T478_9ACTN|nr:zf-HC2 domain-containing protein [Kineosporia babensis]MCD5316498.1 zf-HC2 domain-containing protein [Kineosporia babensis]
MSTQHPEVLALELYTAGDPGLDDAEVWSIEAHLETCEQCRQQQTGILARVDPSGADLLARVADGLDLQIAAGPPPAPAPARFAVRQRWAAWSLAPWTGMALGVLAAAWLLSRVSPGETSMVLLLAPVLPLLPVAGSWSRYADPAWELLAGSPRVGLWMLLRRTLAVLLVIIPALLLVSFMIGLAPALWLLPCLGLTLSTLALSEKLGVTNAAVGIWALWTVGVLLPSFWSADVPPVLSSSATPVWGALCLIAAAVVAIRARGYARL